MPGLAGNFMDGDIAMGQQSRLEVYGNRFILSESGEPYQHHAMPSCVYDEAIHPDATRVSISYGEDHVA